MSMTLSSLSPEETLSPQQRIVSIATGSLFTIRLNASLTVFFVVGVAIRIVSTHLFFTRLHISVSALFPIGGLLVALPSSLELSSTRSMQLSVLAIGTSLFL